MTVKLSKLTDAQTFELIAMVQKAVASSGVAEQSKKMRGKE